MNKNNLPNNLYELRKNAGLSQEEFAERLNVSRQAVSKWERGEAYPETDNLICISELFGVTIDNLLKSMDVISKISANEDINPCDSDDINNEDDAQEDTAADSNLWLSILYAVPYPIVTIIFFWLIGLLTDGWSWGWTLFMTIPVYYSLLDAVKKRRASHFAYPVFLAFIYCLSGMLLGIWHPAWIIFVTIPIYYSISEAIDKHNRKKIK